MTIAAFQNEQHYT